MVSLILMGTDLFIAIFMIQLDKRADMHDQTNNIARSFAIEEFEKVELKDILKFGTFFWIINFGTFIAYGNL